MSDEHIRQINGTQQKVGADPRTGLSSYEMV